MVLHQQVKQEAQVLAYRSSIINIHNIVTRGWSSSTSSGGWSESRGGWVQQQPVRLGPAGATGLPLMGELGAAPHGFTLIIHYSSSSPIVVTPAVID
jgi:hypothetical protein